MQRHLPSFVLLPALGLSFIVGGCSSDGTSSTASKGATPTLTNLSFKTTTLAVSNKTQVLSGTVDFADADGDFDAVDGKGMFGQTPVQIPRMTVAGASGEKAGSMILQLALPTSTKGTYDLEFWGIDKNGNESNHEHVQIDVK